MLASSANPVQPSVEVARNQPEGGVWQSDKDAGRRFRGRAKSVFEQVVSSLCAAAPSRGAVMPSLCAPMPSRVQMRRRSVQRPRRHVQDVRTPCSGVGAPCSWARAHSRVPSSRTGPPVSYARAPDCGHRVPRSARVTQRCAHRLRASHMRCRRSMHRDRQLAHLSRARCSRAVARSRRAEVTHSGPGVPCRRSVALRSAEEVGDTVSIARVTSSLPACTSSRRFSTSGVIRRKSEGCTLFFDAAVICERAIPSR